VLFVNFLLSFSTLLLLLKTFLSFINNFMYLIFSLYSNYKVIFSWSEVQGLSINKPRVEGQGHKVICRCIRGYRLWCGSVHYHYSVHSQSCKEKVWMTLSFEFIFFFTSLVFPPSPVTLLRYAALRMEWKYCGCRQYFFRKISISCVVALTSGSRGGAPGARPP